MKPKYTIIIISISLNSSAIFFFFFFFFYWACHSAFYYCLLCNCCHVEVPYLSCCEHTCDALKCCLGRQLTRFWNRAWMCQPLNGDSASPQSLADSNCYHLGPLFCSLSASVFPNHVSIQKPKCHLCVCVWLQLQSQSFGEQPIKPMRERESFVTSLILLLLLYEIFLTNGTLSLSFPVCVCNPCSIEH